jgi:hypothetical protein
MSRPTNIFNNKSRRRKVHPDANLRTYKRQAAADYKKALDKLLYGSLGGASPVRRIDPRTGNVVAVIDPNSGTALPKAENKAGSPIPDTVS